MKGSLPRPFSPTDAKRDREEKARLAERGDGSLRAASGKTGGQLAAERAEREAALAENQVRLDALNTQLATELPALNAGLTENATQVAQAQADITAANGQIGIVQTAVVAADAKAAAAQTAAATADTKAGTAQTAADAAAAAAASASGIAAGKGKVLTQAPAPGAEDQNVNTLWIDTTGGSNTPKRWTTGTTWVAVTDKAATDAAAAAAAAQTKANTAFTDAQTALANAGSAQSSANGKNNVYYLAVLPSGTGFADGDTVFIRPAVGQPITAQWRWDKPSLTWKTETLSHQVIASLDLGKATVGELNGSYITAKSLQADKILIASGANLFTDPLVKDAPGWSAYFTATGGKNGGGCLTLPMNTSQSGAYYALAAGLSPRRTRLVPGGTYRLGGWVKTSAAAPVGTVQLYLRYQGEDSATGALAANVPGAIPYNTVATVANTWTFITGMVTVPESTTYTTGVLGVFKQAGYTTGTTLWSDLSLQQAMAGELIVDGSVTATKVSTDAILANHIKAGEIIAGKLATDSVLAANIKAGEVTAVKILAGSIGTNHMTANSINADRLVAGSIVAAKLSAGAVTADKLETDLVLASKIIAGPATGTHAEMSPQGFRVYAADPLGGPSKEVVRLGVAATSDFLAVTNSAGELVTTADEAGKVSSLELHAKNALWYKGNELGALLNDSTPLIAAAQRTTNSKNNAVAGGAFIPYLRLEVKLKPYRMYKIWTSAIRVNVDANTGATVALGYQNNIIADIANVAIFTQANTEAQANGGARSVVLQELFAFPGTADATISFLLMFGVQEGAGQAAVIAAAQQPVRLVVEDRGPTQASVTNGVWLDSATAPPVAKNTYVKAYGAYDSMNYQGSNAQYAFDTGRMYQGLSPAGYGNLKSLALFPDMTADLSGATINYIRVYFNFQHWYNNAGGTARIGVHGQTGIPITFGSNGVVATSGGWPKPGARWVDLPSSVFANFKSGAYRGVTLEGDSTYGTYGYADRPTIEISYTK